MRRSRPTAVLAVMVLLGLALAGCGGAPRQDLSGLTAAQLLAKATKALTGQRYVSVTGTIGTTATETALDLHYIGHSASYGSLTVPQGSIRFERVAGTTWLRPDAGFLKAQLGASAAPVIKLIGDKWILADPSNKAFAELNDVASRDFIDSQVLSPGSKVTRAAPATISGTRCLTLKTKTGTLYLDATTALPVQVVGMGGASVGRARFTYDHLDAPTAPPAAKQVDLSKLVG